MLKRRIGLILACICRNPLRLVRHGRLLQGGQDVVQVRTACDLRVLRGLPVGRERRQLLRIGCG